MFGFGGNYLWAIIILILIVLQWFRVGYGGGAGGGVPGVVEPGLMSNGGLFIITIFIIIVCACFYKGGMVAPMGGPGLGMGYGGYGGYLY